MRGNRLSGEKYLGVVMKPFYLCVKTSILKIVVFFIILNITVPVYATETSSALSPQEIKELAKQIKAVENKLHNIKIQSEGYIERRTSTAEPWIKTPIYVSSTAWFDGRPKGKSRIDVHKQVLEWKDGAAPYSESSFSLGFDGQFGRSAIHSTGYSGKTFSHKKGKLTKSQKDLGWSWSDQYTGIQFTLNYHFSGRQHTFYDIFKHGSEANYIDKFPFKFSHEKFEGIKCIKVSTKNPKSKTKQESWWLDPSRGFALLGYKWTGIDKDGNEQLVRSINVTKLKKVARGIWWPMEVSMISSSQGWSDKPWERFIWRASNVVANDPKFNETVFTVPFPEGYLIDDKVAGKKYRVGEKPKEGKDK